MEEYGINNLKSATMINSGAGSWHMEIMFMPCFYMLFLTGCLKRFYAVYDE
jgi:hypothetical protein